MSSILRIMGNVINREVNVMTFFGYVDRQKAMIRGRHRGEEIFLCKGCGRVIKEGESAFAQGASRAGDREQDMTVEQIFCALDRMKGLNRRERERCARAASAV